MEDPNNIRPGRRHSPYLPLFFALVLVAGVMLGTLLAPVIRSGAFFSLPFGKYDKLNDVINYIEKSYVDTVDHETLVEKAISGLLHSLDPHSEYISAEKFSDANDPLVGNFDGIGVQFRVIRDSITVILPVPGGPAAGEGIQDGDRIVNIDGKNVAGIKISDQEVMKRLKGPRGTRVKVGVFRKGEEEILDFTLTRAPIPTWSVDIAWMADATTGYIKLSKFSGTTAEEMRDALLKLKSQGMKKLIFDLRGNGGGYMDAAIAVADEFLPQGKLIVYTEGRFRPRKNFTSTAGGVFETGKVVILIDEWSASASEIVAGAIQDHDRGIIVGRRTFGKGLVQEQSRLPDGSALRITVARYYTPTGRSIQRPYSDNYDAYYEEFYQRLLEEDEAMADSVNMSDTVRYTTSGGRVVYGGGGIMPDVYVPAASGNYSGYYKKLNAKGIFYGFAFDYADRNRQRLKKYGNAQNYLRGFTAGAEMMSEFVAYAASQGVPPDDKGLQQSYKYISAILKGAIGRNIFNDDAFYPAILSEDPAFRRAVESIQSDKL
jgi:carboxyl-terminal processing protease